MAERKPICGNCEFGKVLPQNIKTRLCWGGPPAVITLPAPGGIQVKSVRPMVDASEPGCGMHRFNDLSSIEVPAPASAGIAAAETDGKPN